MDTSIRFAHTEEFPALMNMWKTCFHDTDAGTEHTFSQLQKPENILVLLADSVPVSMLSIQEFALTSPASRYKAAYVYAVATLPEYQKKGYSTKLLDDLDVILKHRGFACSVLVPAQDSLFGFYEKRGYETAFHLNKASFEASQIGEGERCALVPIDIKRFAEIRDGRFGDSKMFACWSEEYLRFIEADCRLYGGGVLGFEHNGRSGCAVCYREGETIYVKELAVTEQEMDAVIRAIKRYFADARQFVLYLHEGIKIPYTNNLLPFGMVKWYDSKVKTEIKQCAGAPPYIAHVLD